MRYSPNAGLAAVLFYMALTPQFAQAQDIEAGRAIATRWCSNCHNVTAGGGTATDRIPSFLSISQMSSTTLMSLTVFLQTPHNRMPDFNLTRREIADVSSYILDLKRQKQPSPAR